MKLAVLCVAVLGTALAAPNGHYHQEYNYKSSSKSFRNNELQRSTDDQGYYRKDGDLEGRQKPVVDANSEHSEYVNPNLRNGQYAGYNANTDMSSYGQLHAEGGGYGGGVGSGAAYGSNNYAAEGSYGSNAAYGSNYGASSYGSRGYYGQNIQSLARNIQLDLQRQLQEQIREHNAYSQQRLDLEELERQVRQNISERFTNDLRTAYGQQSIRNGMSYSIVGGKLQSNANYNEEDLDNLRRDMENTLLNELRTGYNQRYYQESHHGSSYSYGGTYSTTIRPTSYQTIYPSIPHVTYTTVRPAPLIDGHSGYQTVNTHARYTPIPNPESITSILTRIQSDLDVILNRQLDEVYRQYFSSSQAYQLANTDVVLQRLQNELRNNLTYLIQEHIRNNYGTQVERSGYMYSVGPNGQVSEDSNYSMRDLENLQATVERHLIQKLTETFQSYKTGYERSQRTQAAYVYSTTPRYEVFTTPRYMYNTPRYSYSTPAYHQSTVYYPTTPSYYSSTPNYYVSTPVSSGAIYTKGGGNRYGYSSGSSYSGYETSGGAASSSSSIAQLQNQFQSELQRELNSALTRYYNTYSAGSGSYNPQAYQASLQQLSDELNRNVSRHLQEYSASASWSASGNYNQGQVDSMKDQLLANLMRQLEQNLQQHFQSSSSSSYSYSGGQAYSSGGHANYRPVRDNYQMGQYRSGGQVMVGEDCVHDDPNSYRAKRNAYQPYRNQGSSYGRNYGGSYRSPSPDQQTEDLDLGQHTLELGQELDETDDLPQQVEDVQQIEDVQLPYQERDSELGQHTLDDTQQIEDDEFGNLEVGQQQIDSGNSDTQLTEVEDLEYGKLNHDTSPTTMRNTASQGNVNVDSTQQVIQPSDLNANKRTEEVVKDTIEKDLSQQLEYTVQKYKQLSQSSRTLSQVYIQEISNQLERNVTQKLREAYADGSSSYTQSSKPTDDAEFLALKDKIYKELWENFQHKVEQSYQSSSSWQSGTTQHVSSITRQTYGQQRPVEHSPYSTTSSYLENSQSEQLNKRQIRFVKYAKDKLSVDLREAIKEHRRNKHLPNYSKTDRQIVNEVHQNVTDALNSYSEYFLHDYLGLSEQQIRNIKNQITDELKLQAQSQLTSYDYQEQTIVDQSDEESPQKFHSTPQVPSISWSQNQDLDHNSEFLGQVIENDDVQHIESKPYQKPVIDSLVNAPEPLQEQNSQSQLNSNIDQNKLLGQTIEDEDAVQKVDNEFSPPSQTPPLQKPYQYNVQSQNSPSNEFTGQEIDDEDTQQVETELHPHNQVIETKPTLSQISTDNKQNAGRGIHEGQITVDYDDEGQKVEDEFNLPTLEPYSPLPLLPPKPQSSVLNNNFGYRTTQKPQSELYGPLPPIQLQNPPVSQPPSQNTFGFGQSTSPQNLQGPANQPPTQNTFGYGQEVPSQNLQPPVQHTIGYGQQVPSQNWQPSAQNTVSYGKQVDDTQKTQDELYIPPLSPPLSPPPPPPPVQYVPYGYRPQQVVVVPAGGQYGYIQQPNNFYPRPQYPYNQPDDQLKLQNTNQNINNLYDTQQRQTQFFPQPYHPVSHSRPQYDNSQMRHNTNAFLETEIDHQQNNMRTLNQVTEQQRDNKPSTEINLPRENNDLEDDVEQVPERQPTGTWVGVTDQGQMISQSQSRQEAESTADQLVETLRAHVNKNNQGGQGRTVSENPLVSQPSSNIDYRYRPNSYSGNRGDISYNPYGSHVIEETSSVLPTPKSTTSRINYGVQQSIPEYEEIDGIEPLETAQANVIQNVPPQPNAYSGVKGRRLLPVQAQTVTPTQAAILPNAEAVSEVDPVGNIETREETTPIIITDENLPWWKKFGNKVKQGAQNLKQKIVG